MTWLDFISGFGGICGLCLGISFVSVVEILYWFSIRLCKKFWSINNAKSVSICNILMYLIIFNIFWCTIDVKNYFFTFGVFQPIYKCQPEHFPQCDSVFSRDVLSKKTEPCMDDMNFTLVWSIGSHCKLHPYHKYHILPTAILKVCHF